MTAHRARFTLPADGVPVIGQPAATLSSGPGYTDVPSDGTYVGVVVDEEDGIARHMLRGGTLGVTYQGPEGLHGIPVAHFTA